MSLYSSDSTPLPEATEPAVATPVVVPAPPPPVPRKHDWIAIALLVLLPTIYYGDVILGINNFYMRDLTRYYYPAKQILRDIARNGEFPYWNRYFSGGQPIAANPEHEVFYPFTWLILLPSYYLGFRLHILIHIYIGLLGMYALLRSMHLRPPSAVFGALAFGLGGIYLSYVNLLPILFCAAWLPLTFLFVRRFLLLHRARDFALAALFLGLQFLVAEPTTVIQTGFLVGMYGLYRGWYAAEEGEAATNREPGGSDSPVRGAGSAFLMRLGAMTRNTISVGLISIAAFLVGCAQMLPAFDHVADCARSRPFDFGLVEAWSMPWAKFAELIYPNILGHIAIHNIMWYYGGGLYTGMGSPFLFSIYCGIAVTALVIGGAFSRPRGGRFVLLICVVSFLLALGGHTPLLRWLYDAHITSSLRYFEKFSLMALFAMILFASQTLQRALDRDDVAARDTAAGFALATALVATIIATVAWTPLYANVFMKVWGLTKGPAANYMVEISRVDWIVAAARGALLTAVLLTMYTRRRALWLACAFAFVCADLLVVVFELNPRMPARFFTEPPPAQSALRPNRVSYRVFHEADWYGQDEVARQFFSTGDAVYWIVRDGLFPMTPAGSKLRTVLERDYDKTALLPTVDLVDSVWDVKRSGRADWYRPFMAMSNAWYRGTYKTFADEKKRVKDDFRKAMPIRFFEGKHYPRYYFADEIVHIKDRDEFISDLSKNDYSDRVAFIVEKAFVPADGVVRALKETANDADIDVESFGRGFLVMSVTPHKYWRVTLDGKPVKTVITNIGYQGLAIPPGRHHVAMRYRNTLAQRGLATTLVTSALLLFFVLLPRRTRPAS